MTAKAPLTVTVPDAARYTGIPRSSLYKGLRTGEIPAIRRGRSVRIPAYWLEQQFKKPIEQILNGAGEEGEQSVI